MSHHFRGGVIEPLRVDADAHALQVRCIPALHGHRGLLQRDRFRRVRSGDDLVDQRHILHRRAEGTKMRHAPAQRRGARLTHPSKSGF